MIKIKNVIWKKGIIKVWREAHDMDTEGPNTFCQVVNFYPGSQMSHGRHLGSQRTGLALHSEKITQAASGTQTNMRKNE